MRVGYYSPDVARHILRRVEELERREQERAASGARQPVPAIIAKAPGGGIAARSGTTVSSASCTVWRINDSDTLVNVKDNSNSNLSVDVYHLGSTAVAADAYIQAAWINGKWVAMMEDCG